MRDGLLEYDADEVLDRLRRASQRGRAAFAAGCLELLVRHFATPVIHDRPVIREVISECLLAARTPEQTVSSNDARRLRETAEEALTEIDDSVLGTGENVLIATAYAITAVAEGDPDQITLVANHVYDAADAMALTQTAGTAIDEDVVLASPMVQDHLKAIASLLDLVEGPGAAGDGSIADAVMALVDRL